MLWTWLVARSIAWHRIITKYDGVDNRHACLPMPDYPLPRVYRPRLLGHGFGLCCR